MQEGKGGPPFPEHFDGKRFFNPNAPQARGLLDVFRWKLTSRPPPSLRFVFDVEACVPPPDVEAGQLRVTLVNHSTVLLQQNGLNILTDPIWSDRASPLSWIGPRRRRIPGVRREDLPRIDIVLISHNHYDHLDLPTLRWLSKRGDSIFVVPRGVAKSLRSKRIGPLRELDWGDFETHGATTVHCVPALHFSARGAFDRNKTLWCGYVVQSRDKTIYFAGDTAFGEHFSEIRRRFGAPGLSLLPIGAYLPVWFMSAVHMAPWEALEAHRLLGSQTSIATHHGTFALADDGIDGAREHFAAATLPDSFLVLNNGQSRTMSW